MVGRLAVAMALGGELELAQRLGIELKDIGLRASIEKARSHRPILIGLVGGLKYCGLSGMCTVQNPPFSM
jgi:hypothetical protein